jgi:murein DD-endopeptidase MepM/ murein hydrolase activator NlpD
MAGQNLVTPDDEKKAAGTTSKMDKAGKGFIKDMKTLVDMSEKFAKNFEKAAKAMSAATGGKYDGSQKLGLGSFTRTEKIVGGAALATAAVGGLAYSMAPDTMAAVTQRMALDTYAGRSGMSTRKALGLANKQVGNGATSAMGPTMAATALAYQGGYLANSLSSKNVMSQVGGLSAISGGSNEQVAGAIAGMNGMSFLRMGVRTRDSKGNQRPMNQVINDTYNFLYGGRKITAEQAQMVYNPNSKGYQSLMAVAGGDPNLLGILQAGIVARASKGGGLKKGDLNNSNKALDLMGVAKDSPIRSQFRYNSSEARKLQATESGLVGGYNVALRTTASVNDGFSSLAEALPSVTQALMTFKGALQTFPGAGNTGATLSNLGGMAAGGAANIGQMLLAANLAKRVGIIGPGAAAAAAGGGGAGAAGAAGATGLGAGLMSMLTGKGKFKATGILAKGSKAAKFGRVGLAAGIYTGLEKAQQWLNKKGNKLPGWAKWLGNMAFDIGQGGLTGLAAGGVPGAFAGMAAGGVGNLATGGVKDGGMGGGDGGCSHGSMGCSHGMGGPEMPTSGSVASTAVKPKGNILQMPVPPGTKVTSPYGPRPDAAKRNPGISSNHSGIDYGVPVGTSIAAAGDGTVSETGMHRQYGRYLIIKHAGGKSTMYAHLSKILVKKGDKVTSGQEVAKSGGAKGSSGAGTSTGPHLHFEVRDHGGVGAQGRKDPRSFFGKAFQFIKNMVTSGINIGKRVINRVFNKELPYSDVSGSGRPFTFNSISDLNSAELGALVKSKISSGSPVGWDDVNSYLDKGGGKVGLGKKRGTAIFNSEENPVSGDSAGMTGGSRKGLMRMLHAQGFRGAALQTAFAVALAESGGRADAVGDKHLVSKKWGPSYGAFQIRSLKDWKAYNDPYRDGSRLKNAEYNIAAGYEKSNQGKHWKGWTTFTSGTFTKFLDDAATTQKAAGIGGADNGIGGSENIGSAQSMSLGATTGAQAVNSSRSTSSFSTASKQDINVTMHVQIAQASNAEAEAMVRKFKKVLEDELRLNGIGTY